MTTLTPSTKLQAVNTMLATIGEAPISTLVSPGLLDAVNAIALLDEINREVQTLGWQFNTEDNYELALDSDSKIPIPSNTLRVDTWGPDEVTDVTSRGGFLYNKTTHSFIFTKSVKVEIIVYLDFEDIPESARRYITIRAAKKFQDRWLGDNDTHAYSAQDELDALSILKESEGDTGDYSMLSYQAGSYTSRYRGIK